MAIILKITGFILPFLLLSALACVVNGTASRLRNLRGLHLRRALPPQKFGALCDPYSVLGCPPEATEDEIRRAYKSLVLKYHPDRVKTLGLDEEFVQLASKRFQEIRVAYVYLMALKRKS
ncbi:MAG TPA: J domain-containing protein [Thermosynergistes sp.]|nr:J domain-containing protein [Thermosynergistes sp.]